MKTSLLAALTERLEEMEADGLRKVERVIEGPQGVEIRVAGGRVVLNFCANNYLGLSAHPEVVAAAKAALDTHGYGLSSVRFICGTQDLHKELEAALARFFGMEDAILYAAAFDANGGLFEPLLGPEDAILSDALNHASIIDGVRLCKAARERYAHAEMEDLERSLREARTRRHRLIVTDGVFSMDGDVAKLPEICALAERYEALVVVDDCHAAGFLGATGRGTPELCGVQGRVDILTGTLGKALGGGLGGFTAGPAPVIEMLRQRSRPYLFSNSLPPAIVGASLQVLAMLEASTSWRDRLMENVTVFKAGLDALGFDLKPSQSAIVALMLYDARLARRMADRLLEEGIYVMGFSYPVVPKGQARIRLQLSAAHTPTHLDRALDALAKVGRELGIIV
jgi:glycine C-acetyltransferase